jgi:hypothetical protein
VARSKALRPVLGPLAVLLTAALSLAGCVSMPTGGPVQSYPVTQGTDAQSQQYMQLQPQPPGAGWNPTQIVEGFLTASASFGNYGQVIEEYLTPQEQKNWTKVTNWSALVYKSGPDPSAPSYPSSPKDSTTATVQVNGSIQASLKGSGSYSVPSASSQDAGYDVPLPFQLEKISGQWRISYAPPELLLTNNSFERDYQQQDLYFFDPTGTYLVPDPVYVPLGANAQDLVNGLVNDLITPPGDWLSEKNAKATKTAFPAGTKISKTNGVELNGVTAVVNLTGTITKANSQTLLQASAQLLSTLQDAPQGGQNGQAVKSVEVELNGKPWAPPDTPNNPVQQSPQYHPAYGASNQFYYVDNAGYLTSQTADGPARRLAKIGTGYSQIAVSADGAYVAALRGGTLYAGLIGGPLVKRAGGYMAISWDPSDDLWASTGGQIVMFRGSARARQALGKMIPVKVQNLQNQIEPPYTALKVAPDGVRVAIVQNGGILTYGAISGPQGPDPQIWLSTVQEDPLTQPNPGDVSFTSLAWYGPDDVITLATPGPTVTEYPVSGGTPVSIPTDSAMQTIAASYRQPLIAGLPKEALASDASLTGSWMPIIDGDTLISGSSPTYPG